MDADAAVTCYRTCWHYRPRFSLALNIARRGSTNTVGCPKFGLNRLFVVARAVARQTSDAAEPILGRACDVAHRARKSMRLPRYPRPILAELKSRGHRTARSTIWTSRQRLERLPGDSGAHRLIEVSGESHDHVSYGFRLSRGRIEARVECEWLLRVQPIPSRRARRVEQEVPAFVGDRAWDDHEHVLF